MQIHKIQNFVQVMFRPIIRTDKTYVGCKYTNFITSSGIFHALFVSSAVCQVSKNVLLRVLRVKFVAHIQYSYVAIRS